MMTPIQKVIVYGLSGSGYESWRHVYTAVTRGKKKVVIVGSYRQLEKAVKKKPTKRQTALCERVRKMLGSLIAKKAAEEKSSIVEEKETFGKNVKGIQEPVLCATPEKKSTSDKNSSPCFTPTKLSSMFEDSMRDWGSQEEELAAVFKADSPGKRTIGATSERSDCAAKIQIKESGFSKPAESTAVRKRLGLVAGVKERIALRNGSDQELCGNALSYAAPPTSKPGLGRLGLTPLERVKRSAADSPASYRATCIASSPATYQVINDIHSSCFG